MAEYCDKCSGEILDDKCEGKLERAICQALLLDLGVRISPRPSYCRCNEGLPPLVLGEKESSVE